jgi:polysaccharide export outer membrane protein
MNSAKIVYLLSTCLLCYCRATNLAAQAASAHQQVSAEPPKIALAENMPSLPGPQLGQRYPRYSVQFEDVLFITFPLSPELNQTVTVQPDGYINLWNAGSIHVQGDTVPDLVEMVKRAYAGVLHEPVVNVDVVDFQKPFFTVSGQVSKPGQYELRASITPLEAIAIAGGLAPTAKTQIFLFHRTSQDWFAVQKLNLKDILNGKHVNESAVLKPGDVIFVPEKFISNFRKYVPYSLNVGSYLQTSSL